MLTVPINSRHSIIYLIFIQSPQILSTNTLRKVLLRHICKVFQPLHHTCHSINALHSCSDTHFPYTDMQELHNRNIHLRKLSFNHSPNLNLHNNMDILRIPYNLNNRDIRLYRHYDNSKILLHPSFCTALLYDFDCFIKNTQCAIPHSAIAGLFAMLNLF